MGTRYEPADDLLNGKVGRRLTPPPTDLGIMERWDRLKSDAGDDHPYVVVVGPAANTAFCVDDRDDYRKAMSKWLMYGLDIGYYALSDEDQARAQGF
jgi:hypothetical protein